MLHYPTGGLTSQRRRRAGTIRDAAAITRLPFVTHELEELAPLYDDVAANDAAGAETGASTTSDTTADGLIDHLPIKARHFREQAWTASDRSLAEQLRFVREFRRRGDTDGW